MATRDSHIEAKLELLMDFVDDSVLRTSVRNPFLPVTGEPVQAVVPNARPSSYLDI